MLRTCPTCGAYYADLSLAFCFDDGTPLVAVDPVSEKWSEGERVVKQKEQALRKEVRRLKWRRILTSAMTVSMVTIVVCVVALNGVFYFKPSVFPTPLAIATSTPSPTPTRTQTPAPSQTPTPSPTPPTSPTPAPSPTPTPVVVYTLSGRVMVSGHPRGGIKIMLNGEKTASTTTDSNGRYIFSALPSGGSYTITPAESGMNFTPARRSFKRLAHDASTDFLAAIKDPPAGCPTEKSEAEAIIAKYGLGWQPQAEIPSNHNQINTPIGPRPRRPEGTPPQSKYAFAFKSCTAVAVTVKYVWKVARDQSGGPGGARETTKRFDCAKTARSWQCKQTHF